MTGPYCVYCLVAVRNSATQIEVKLPTEPVFQSYAGGQSIRVLLAWLAAHDQDPRDIADRRFLLNGVPGSFTQIGTWHGDAVCENHMLWLVKE